jgi:hypothetical protein
VKDALKNALKDENNRRSGLALYLKGKIGEQGLPPEDLETALNLSKECSTLLDNDEKDLTSGALVNTLTNTLYLEMINNWAPLTDEKDSQVVTRATALLDPIYLGNIDSTRRIGKLRTFVSLVGNKSLIDITNLANLCLHVKEVYGNDDKITYEALFSHALKNLSPALKTSLAILVTQNQDFIMHVRPHFKYRAPERFPFPDGTNIKTVLSGIEGNVDTAISTIVTNVIKNAENAKSEHNDSGINKTFSYTYNLGAGTAFNGLNNVNNLIATKYGTKGLPTTTSKPTGIELVLNFSKTRERSSDAILKAREQYIGTCYPTMN